MLTFPFPRESQKRARRLSEEGAGLDFQENSLLLHILDGVARPVPCVMRSSKNFSHATEVLVKYRADIDGLRAIAVVSVILFHIDSELLPGGFLGVDIFFVISGFLITNLLLSEASTTGTISILSFYKRRVQRIFPALMFMLLGVLVFGYIALLPEDFNRLLASTVWSLISSANIYFYAFLDTSYFASSSAESPLLHLWSLGVEEQFYIVWPLLILLMAKLSLSPIKKAFVVTVMLAASVLACELLRPQNFSFSYYMLPSRAWEMLAGGLIALPIWRRCTGNFAAYISAFGLMLLLGSLFLVNEHWNIPGVAAAPAVLGSAILIFAGQGNKNIVSTLLSNKVLVQFGLVSFSAYLWHWPILAFLRYAMVDISGWVAITMFVATFLIAFISYHVVEQPFRRMKPSPSEAIGYIFAIPSLVILAFAFIVTGLINSKSETLYNWKLLAEIATTVENIKPAIAYEFNCQETDFRKEILSDKRCVFPQGASPDTLLVGDSHGAHFVGMMRTLALTYGFSFRNATQSACSLIFSPDVSTINPNYKVGCLKYRESIEKEVGKYKNIVIGGIWHYYLLNDGDSFKRGFEKTVAELASKKKNIILIEQAPEFLPYSLKCMERNFNFNLVDCAHRFDYKKKDTDYNKFISSLSNKYPNVRVFKPSEYLCPDGVCSPYVNGEPLYYDKTHLSMEGSAVFGGVVARIDTAKTNPFANLANSTPIVDQRQ